MNAAACPPPRADATQRHRRPRRDDSRGHLRASPPAAARTVRFAAVELHRHRGDPRARARLGDRDVAVVAVPAVAAEAEQRSERLPRPHRDQVAAVVHPAREGADLGRVTAVSESTTTW